MAWSSWGSTHPHVVHVGHHIVHHHVVAAPVDVSRVPLLLYLDALHASLILLVGRSVRGGHHPPHGTTGRLPGVGRPHWPGSSHGRRRSDLTEEHALRPHGSAHSGPHLLSPHTRTDLVDVLLPVGPGNPALTHSRLELLVGHPSPANKVVWMLL